MLVAFFRAGSRAGLLTLGGLVLSIFFRARLAQKIALMITVVVVAAAAVVALPSNLRERYTTFFSADVDQNCPRTLLRRWRAATF